MNKNKLLDGETLCKECGLCCEGVFHTFAYLYTDVDMRIMQESNIPIIFDNEINSNIFRLQCPAFNGLCAIYPKRPSVCECHQCDLLKSVIHNDMALDDSLSRVFEIKNVLNDILPILRSFDSNQTSNKPEYLMKNILDNIKSKSDKNTFKQENKTLFIKYGIFYFLKGKYFYKESTALKK